MGKRWVLGLLGLALPAYGATWLGCNGSTAAPETGDGGGGGGETGSNDAVYDTSTGQDAAGDDSAGNDSGGTDAGNDALRLGDGAPLTCGAGPCTGTDVCCAVVAADGGPDLECFAACPDGGAPVGCLGPTQCNTGAAPYCCATLVLGSGTAPQCPIDSVSSACVSNCLTSLAFSCPAVDTVRLCEVGADCAGEPTGATSCCTFMQGGRSVTMCVSNTIAVFGTCLP